eukprot:gene20099-26818_t
MHRFYAANATFTPAAKEQIDAWVGPVPWENHLHHVMRAYMASNMVLPYRQEPLYQIAKLHRTALRDYEACFSFAAMAHVQGEPPPNALFITQPVYDYFVLGEMCTCGYYTTHRPFSKLQETLVTALGDEAGIDSAALGEAPVAYDTHGVSLLASTSYNLKFYTNKQNEQAFQSVFAAAMKAHKRYLTAKLEGGGVKGVPTLEEVFIAFDQAYQAHKRYLPAKSEGGGVKGVPTLEEVFIAFDQAYQAHKRYLPAKSEGGGVKGVPTLEEVFIAFDQAYQAHKRYLPAKSDGGGVKGVPTLEEVFIAFDQAYQVAHKRYLPAKSEGGGVKGVPTLEEVFIAFDQAYQTLPQRQEPLYMLAHLYRTELGNYKSCAWYAQHAIEQNEKFASSDEPPDDVYSYTLLSELCSCGLHTTDFYYNLGFSACENLMIKVQAALSGGRAHGSVEESLELLMRTATTLQAYSPKKRDKDRQGQGQEPGAGAQEELQLTTVLPSMSHTLFSEPRHPWASSILSPGSSFLRDDISEHRAVALPEPPDTWSRITLVEMGELGRARQGSEEPP